MAEQVQQVMTKDPKRVKAGKRLAASNPRKREELKAQRERETKLTYYGAGAVIAIGVLGVISYYVYEFKTPKETPVNQPKESPVHQPKETSANKFDMD